MELLILASHILLAGSVACHAALHKHDPRSAWAWILTCLLIPVMGTVLYYWFGINRLERRALHAIGSPVTGPVPPSADARPQISGTADQEVAELVRLGRAVTRRALIAGNAVEPLFDGARTYAAMLAQIDAARESIWLMTYIFDRGAIGEQFALALRRAIDRGVQVRVLIDGFGDWRLPGRGSTMLRRHGIPVALFLPPRLLPMQLYVNLRSHRKLLCVDGGVAFCGGMNIGDHHVAASEVAASPTRWRWRRGDVIDLHCRVEGPVVAQLASVFAEDWAHVTGEVLATPAARGHEAAAGEAYCRAIADGPNERVGRLQIILLGALANAHRCVHIMTPYFVPTPALSSALTAAVLRGVEVTLLLPERSNHWWLDAATRRWLAQWSGIPLKVMRRPAPFAHSKLFMVDDYYAIVGSANLDPRSLRLNFELMLEIYDVRFVGAMRAHFESQRALSTPVDLEALNTRPVLRRLWDSVFWLLSPYL